MSDIDEFYTKAIIKGLREGYTFHADCPPSFRNKEGGVDFKAFATFFKISITDVKDDGTARLEIRGPKGSKVEKTLDRNWS